MGIINAIEIKKKFSENKYKGYTGFLIYYTLLIPVLFYVFRIEQFIIEVFIGNYPYAGLMFIIFGVINFFTLWKLNKLSYYIAVIFLASISFTFLLEYTVISYNLIKYIYSNSSKNIEYSKFLLKILSLYFIPLLLFFIWFLIFFIKRKKIFK